MDERDLDQWDAFGICACLHVDGRVEASCADCGAPISVEIHGPEARRRQPPLPVLVPAAQWWDDIVFT